MENIRYFLEKYKPKSADPNITCFKDWIPIRSSKTKRISPSGVSIPVKLYYEKKTENEIDFIEVDKNLFPEECQKENQLEIDTAYQVKIQM